MAVRAFHGVAVVRAFGIAEGGIHLFHVDTAVRKPRVAIGAGLPCGLPVLLVTREAAETFVDSERRAVVSAPGLHPGERRVALVTERLPGGRDSSVPRGHPGRRPGGTATRLRCSGECAD